MENFFYVIIFDNKNRAIIKNNGEALEFLRKKVLHLKIDYSVDIHDQKDIYLTKEWLKNN